MDHPINSGCDMVLTRLRLRARCLRRCGRWPYWLCNVPGTVDPALQSTTRLLTSITPAGFGHACGIDHRRITGLKPTELHCHTNTESRLFGLICCTTTYEVYKRGFNLYRRYLPASRKAQGRMTRIARRPAPRRLPLNGTESRMVFLAVVFLPKKEVATSP